MAAALLSPSFSLAAASHASDVLDMPVDPNEPTYCLCHQVSYGEMIGCDNHDVRYSTPSVKSDPFPFLNNAARVNHCQLSFHEYIYSPASESIYTVGVSPFIFFSALMLFIGL